LSYFTDKILGLLGLKVKINTEFIDFFYCFNVNNYILKPNTIKIIRIHDLIPITNPTLTSSLFSNILFKRNLHFNANETNTYFVCNSEYTKHELLAKYPNLRNKCYVIPCNIQIMSNFKTALITKFFKNYQDILSEKFLFSVSTLEPKKNLYNLLCAWEKLSKNNPYAMPLILVANAGWGEKNTINKLNKLKEKYPNKLIHLQHLPEEIIQLLFYKCTIFIMPSKVEGFGIPVLNAIKYHKPLILSDIKVFREVAADAAIYFNPNSVDDIYNKILSIISKSNKNTLLAKLSKKSAIRSKQYTNEKLANQWRSTLKYICKNTNY
jgi:glycosyltransferase involved in cell wall biosynthesis